MASYKNILDFSDNFTFKFENTGTMHENKIFTAKYESSYQGPYQTLDDILLPEVDDENLFIDAKEGRLEKFEYLKGPKRIPRVSADGHEWVYSEGGMAFPDAGNKPGRTMLTSEKSVNRSTHVVEDKKTGRLRFIHPIEAERLNMFPDNWTNTGMPNNMRYFTMGNALVVGVISAIGKGIDDIMLEENESKLDEFIPAKSIPEVNHVDLLLNLEFTE